MERFQVTQNLTELFLQQGNTQPYFVTEKVQIEYSSVSRESSSLLCSFCHSVLQGKVSGLGQRHRNRHFCDMRGGDRSHKTLLRITHDSRALLPFVSQRKSRKDRVSIMLRGVREDGRAAEPQAPGSIILSGAQLAVLDP